MFHGNIRSNDKTHTHTATCCKISLHEACYGFHDGEEKNTKTHENMMTHMKRLQAEHAN